MRRDHSGKEARGREGLLRAPRRPSPWTWMSQRCKTGHCTLMELLTRKETLSIRPKLQDPHRQHLLSASCVLGPKGTHSRALLPRRGALGQGGVGWGESRTGREEEELLTLGFEPHDSWGDGLAQRKLCSEKTTRVCVCVPARTQVLRRGVSKRPRGLLSSFTTPQTASPRLRGDLSTS